jgi:hypothetical protein
MFLRDANVTDEVKEKRMIYQHRIVSRRRRKAEKSNLHALAASLRTINFMKLSQITQEQNPTFVTYSTIYGHQK